MNIFVGNLSAEVTEHDLEDLFKAFGQVKSTEVKRDMFSGKTKGFGFVEMPGRNHSLTAIQNLNGQVQGSGTARQRGARVPRPRRPPPLEKRLPRTDLASVRGVQPYTSFSARPITATTSAILTFKLNVVRRRR
jgi:RNA recognition motif-containing protein